MPERQEEQTANTKTNRYSTAFSIPETTISDYTPGSMENVILSRETPIMIHNPNPSRQPDPILNKKWQRIFILGSVVLSLAFVLAIVLVVLASLGYFGKTRVEVFDIVTQGVVATATATATVAGTTTASAKAVATGGGTRAVRTVVLESGGRRVGKKVGIVVTEVILAWTLVQLFDLFENQERSGADKGKGKA
jgi:hypothetical protein